MAFSQATILDATATHDGAEVRVSWTTSSPAGTVFQVYVDRALAWSGMKTSTILLLTGTHRLDVGTVAAGENLVDFAASLPSLPATGDTVELTWDGGSWERTELDVAGFHVYSAAAAGGAIDYATIRATVALATQGVEQGGWGQGGWGGGGWGIGQSSYAWTSGHLCPGVWAFGVKAFDVAGNESTAVTTSATLATAPPPPAANPAGQRLTYNNFHLATGHAYATLNWLASPACT